jgi:hypothetical protein
MVIDGRYTLFHCLFALCDIYVIQPGVIEIIKRLPVPIQLHIGIPMPPGLVHRNAVEPEIITMKIFLW